MKKAELIDAIAADAGVSKKDAGAMLQSFTDNVTKALAKKDTVALVGFGTFSTKERAARTGKNPRTGEPLQIKAATVPSFKAGKALKEAVNK